MVVATDSSDPPLTKWVHRDYEEEWKKSTESSRALSLGTLSKEEKDLHEKAENKIRGGKRAEDAYKKAARKGNAVQKAAKRAAEKQAAKEFKAAQKAAKDAEKRAELERKAAEKGEDTSRITPQSRMRSRHSSDDVRSGTPISVRSQQSRHKSSTGARTANNATPSTARPQSRSMSRSKPTRPPGRL